MRSQPVEGDKESGERELNDSIWAVVGGVVKAYNLSIDYVLYELSYVNMVMYCAVLPDYRSGKNKKDKGETIKVDDPRNTERILKMLDKYD